MLLFSFLASNVCSGINAEKNNCNLLYTIGNFDKPLIFMIHIYTNYKHMIIFMGLSKPSMLIYIVLLNISHISPSTMDNSYNYLSAWDLYLITSSRTGLKVSPQMLNILFMQTDLVDYNINITPTTVSINVLNVIREAPTQKTQEMITYLQGLVTSGELNDQYGAELISGLHDANEI